MRERAHRSSSFTAGIADINVFDDPSRYANTIVWGNNAGGALDQLAQIRINHPFALLDYSCIQDLADLPGIGSIDSDPLFVDPLGPDGVAGTLDDDLRLEAGSPCIDAGSNSAVPLDFGDVDGDGDTSEVVPLDLAGTPRFEDDPNVLDSGEGTAPVIDMGPFERTP